MQVITAIALVVEDAEAKRIMVKWTLGRSPIRGGAKRKFFGLCADEKEVMSYWRAAHSHRGFRIGTILSVLAALVLVTPPAIAGLTIENHLAGELNLGTDTILMYDYENSQESLFSSSPAWALGSFKGTQDNGSGALELQRYGAAAPNPDTPWWDNAWSTRQCVTVTNPGPAQTNTPFRVQLDTETPITNLWLNPDASDLRAIDSATGLPLVISVPGAVFSTTTDVWVELADAPTGDSNFCFYMGNATATSTATLYPKATYYAVSDAFDGSSGASGRVSAVSYADGVVVSNGSTTMTLNRGQVGIFDTMGKDSILTAYGPISTSGLASNTPPLVPESLAATEFIFAAERNTQEFWVRSPFDTAVIEVVYDNAVTQTISVAPSDGSVQVVQDNAVGNSVVLRSTNGVDFIATHKADTTDSYVGIPWIGETIYGVQSTRMEVGASVGGATVNILGSTGINYLDVALTANASILYDDGLPRPAGEGYAISSNLPIGANQQEDSNGSASTSFMPLSFLDSEYFAPTAFQYATFVCPTPGTTIQMDVPVIGTSTYECNTTGIEGSPGQTNTPLSVYAAGTRFSSSARFFMYFEGAGDDETGIFGATHDAPYEGYGFTTAFQPHEGAQAPDGTWTAVIDTSSTGVFGLFESIARLPEGTSATIQLISGPTLDDADAATPVGPDGTSATSFPVGTDIVPYAYDGDQFLKVVVSLESSNTSTPVITSLRIDHHLELLSIDGTATATINHPGSTALSTRYLARVRTAPGKTFEAQISYVTASGLPAADQLAIRTDHPATHVAVESGSLTTAAGVAFTMDSATPFSIMYDESTAAEGSLSLTFRLQGQELSGFVRSNDLTLNLTGP